MELKEIEMKVERNEIKIRKIKKKQYKYLCKKLDYSGEKKKDYDFF